LYPATSEAETVRFNLINPATGNRIKMKTVDAGTGEDVSRGDLVKGFAVAKNEYDLLEKEDFERVKLESTRILDIENSCRARASTGSIGTRLSPGAEWKDRRRGLRGHPGGDAEEGHGCSGAW
jgi:hypothetical protein